MPLVLSTSFYNKVGTTTGLFSVSQLNEKFLYDGITANALATRIKIIYGDKHSSGITEYYFIFFSDNNNIALFCITGMYQCVY